MSQFHLGWFLGPGITIQGWNEPGYAPGYDWTKPDIFVDAARADGTRLLRRVHPRGFVGRSLRLQEQHGLLPEERRDDAEVRSGDGGALPDRGDQEARPRPYAHLDLLSAVAAGALALDARSLFERAHRLEHRHRHQRRRGPELRPRQADRPRSALRHGRRVRRLREPALGCVGTRRRRDGRGEQHLHRSQQGQGRELRGQVLQDPAGRSTCRARRRAGRSSWRRAARRAAASSPAATPRSCWPAARALPT